MKNLDNNKSLLEFEKQFEREITSAENNIRIIGDLNISYEDYVLIKERINMLMDYKDNITVWNKYKLCTLVSWVFSLIYEDKNYSASNFLTSFDGFHQYAVRYLLDIYNETFEEFGLEIPGMVINSEETLAEAIILQAGVPDECHKEIYNVLTETLEDGKVNIEREALLDAAPKMRKMYGHLDIDKQKKLMNQYKKVFMDFNVKGLSRDEVLSRNPVASKRVISSFDKFNKDEENIVTI